MARRHDQVDPELDGVDHINVYSQGRTEVGRFLSNFHRIRIDTEDGEFMSIEGYWYWLSCRDDRLRGLSGHTAKKLGRKLRGEDWVDDEWFREKIKKAIVSKFMADRVMFDAFVATDLPLEHYYSYHGKVVKPAGGWWVIEFIEEVRKRAKEST